MSGQGAHPGEQTRAREVATPGTHERLGRYRLVALLGEGGMGVVHLALDPSGRAVAIKVLRPHIAYDPEARSRLEREVDTLARISSSRVAAVIDSDISGERPYLVTRYVAGPSLDDVVTDEGPLDPQQLVVLGRGLVEALNAIHGVGVVHRDLKPGNVLLEDGDPVVIDFGIAHIADDVRLTSSGLVMGTPGYLSPEVIGGSPVTRATDWWGWAATLAFAASGRPPFGRGPMDVVLGRVSRGESDLTGVDPRLTPLLAAALSADPSRRPPALEVIAALERYASGSPATVDYGGVFGTQPVSGALLAEPPARSGFTSALPAEAQLPFERGYDGGHLRGYDPAAGSEPAYDPQPAYDPEEAYDAQESDWQAAWEGRGDDPDPRLVRPARTGTVLALAAVLVALAASRPGVAVLGGVLWCWAARFSDRSVTALVLRRYRNGRRRADLPMAVALSPWHILVSAVVSVAGLILPVLVMASATFCTTLATAAVSSAPVGPVVAPATAVGALLGALIAWWGPGGASLQRGTSSLVRGGIPAGAVTSFVVGMLLVVAAALVVLAVTRQGSLDWWPVPWGSSAR